MGIYNSRIVTFKSIDDLPERRYKIELGKAKYEINDQYNSNTAIIHFPNYDGYTIYRYDGDSYRISGVGGKRFDGELAAHCKEIIKRPYILIGRTVYLVENYQ